MQDTGLLFLLAEPGKDVPQTVFNELYDNKHASACLAVDGINKAKRYTATDSQTPSWLALSEAESPDILQDGVDKPIPLDVSASQKDLVAKADFFDRRVYDLISSRSSPDGGAAKYLFVVSFLVRPGKEDVFNKWYEEEHIREFGKSKGWKWCKRYKLISHAELAARTAPTQEDTERKPVHNFITFHGLDNDNYVDTQVFVDSVSTPWAQEVSANVIIEYKLRRFVIEKDHTSVAKHKGPLN